MKIWENTFNGQFHIYFRDIKFIYHLNYWEIEHNPAKAGAAYNTIWNMAVYKFNEFNTTGT